MKKYLYTTLLGMLMMGMTGGTAWSQVTVTVIGTTATSASFRFETVQNNVEFVVREIGCHLFADPCGDVITLDLAGQIELQTDTTKVTLLRATSPELSATVEGLDPDTSYELYYYDGVGNPKQQAFTTTLFTITPERTFVVGVAQNAASATIAHRGTGKTHYGLSLASASAPTTVADMRALTSYDTIIGDARRELVMLSSLEPATEYKLYVLITNDDKSILWSAVAGSAAFTTLLPNDLESRLTALESQSHAHANLTTLESQSHAHANKAALDVETPHTHANLTTLESQSHAHANLRTLESQSHAHANQTALDAHSHADLAMRTHTHADNDNLLGFQHEHSSVAFIPNPTDDTFTIRGMDSYERIDIYDAQGKMVHMQTRGLSIDLARYPAGTYIARVYTQGGMFTRQLVKE